MPQYILHIYDQAVRRLRKFPFFTYAQACLFLYFIYFFIESRPTTEFCTSKNTYKSHQMQTSYKTLKQYSWSLLIHFYMFTIISAVTLDIWYVRLLNVFLIHIIFDQGWHIFFYEISNLIYLTLFLITICYSPKRYFSYLSRRNFVVNSKTFSKNV